MTDEERRKKFHNIVMLIVHVAQVGRRDLQLTCSFLSQQVSQSTEEDYSKLRRLIRHTIGSMDEILHLGSTDLSIMINFIDATYGVHDDFKSCTGEA